MDLTVAVAYSMREEENQLKEKGKHKKNGQLARGDRGKELMKM